MSIAFGRNESRLFLVGKLQTRHDQRPAAGFRFVAWLPIKRVRPQTPKPDRSEQGLLINDRPLLATDPWYFLGMSALGVVAAALSVWAWCLLGLSGPRRVS